MSGNESSQRSEGNAYGRPPQAHDAALTEVGPGKPVGELMRRYWIPVALSQMVVARPQKLRILGEDLILFRDGKGRPGLLLPRCAHRGTTLYYGKVDDNGIRCCYHGWQFDVQGRCIDQPCEPEGGLHKDKVRQPWYPVQERYGLVFAYMGPPDKQPALPRWDIFENLGPGEKVVGFLTSYHEPEDGGVEIVPHNWLQNWENNMDPFHVPILHISFSGRQFAPELAVMPQVAWETTDLGMRYTAYRKLPDGRELNRELHVLFPNLVSIPPFLNLEPGPSKSLRWVVPVDDTNYCAFNAMRVHENAMHKIPKRGRSVGDKMWAAMTEEEHRDTPSDWEGQVGQGRITLHSEEHLATSDKGVAMLRRLIRQQTRIVQQGGDPIGVTFDPDHVNKVGAGNYYQDQE
jgi:phenylpropionate dioxygenase-like ring-hydroxylating dioxygenase large terminal subunit